MRGRFIVWLSGRNVLFSRLCGEDFTNGEVLLSHIAIVLFILLLGIVGGCACAPGGGL